MSIDERIDDISCMGQRHSIVETNELVKDIVKAISHFYAIPEEDLMKAVEDYKDE